MTKSIRLIFIKNNQFSCVRVQGCDCAAEWVSVCTRNTLFTWSPSARVNLQLSQTIHFLLLSLMLLVDQDDDCNEKESTVFLFSFFSGLVFLSHLSFHLFSVLLRQKPFCSFLVVSPSTGTGQKEVDNGREKNWIIFLDDVLHVSRRSMHVPLRSPWAGIYWFRIRLHCYVQSRLSVSEIHAELIVTKAMQSAGFFHRKQRHTKHWFVKCLPELLSWIARALGPFFVIFAPFSIFQNENNLVINTQTSIEEFECLVYFVVAIQKHTRGTRSVWPVVIIFVALNDSLCLHRKN